MTPGWPGTISSSMMGSTRVGILTKWFFFCFRVSPQWRHPAKHGPSMNPTIIIFDISSTSAGFTSSVVAFMPKLENPWQHMDQESSLSFSNHIDKLARTSTYEIRYPAKVEVKLFWKKASLYLNINRSLGIRYKTTEIDNCNNHIKLWKFITKELKWIKSIKISGTIRPKSQ